MYRKASLVGLRSGLIRFFHSNVDGNNVYKEFYLCVGYAGTVLLNVSECFSMQSIQMGDNNECIIIIILIIIIIIIVIFIISSKTSAQRTYAWMRWSIRGTLHGWDEGVIILWVDAKLEDQIKRIKVSPAFFTELNKMPLTFTGQAEEWRETASFRGWSWIL